MRATKTYPDNLTWTDSTSSHVHSYAYEPSLRRLHVRFRNGTRGHYENVALEMHQKFHTADSHGKFLHAHLKGNDKHPWNRLENGIPKREAD